MTPDPYASYLVQADELFARGEVVKAGQIWQAILKQQPSHPVARQRFVDLKQHLLALRDTETTATADPLAPAAPAPTPILEAEPEPEAIAPSFPSEARPAGPGAVATGSEQSPDRLLAEGCTLYDMGQLEDALLKWDQVLALNPDHALARGYVNGVRRELGRPLLAEQSEPSPARGHDHHVDDDLDKVLRDAVQLYDMGLTEDAITKWERALVLDPQRSDVEGYLRQARLEVGHAAPRTTPAPQAAAAPSQSQAPQAAAAPSQPQAPQALSNGEALDLKLRQAEHLLTMQRHEEAAFTFQQALGLDPGNAMALAGLMRCRKPQGQPTPGTPSPNPGQHHGVSRDAQGRISMDFHQEPFPSEASPVQVPETVAKSQGPAREGLSLPDQLMAATDRLPWLRSPKIIAALGGAFLVLVLVFAGLHTYRKDQALKEEVRAARMAAVTPLAEQTTATDLAETPAAIRQEAEGTLVTDPLRAHLRAEALATRQPGDPAAAQLLQKTRAGLAGGVTGASLPEFQKHLQAGDLEAAAKVMDTLLRGEPGSENLRARAARLHLALCSVHAAQAKWDSAEEDLLRGRALFPMDKTWQVRLRLLDRIKALPKDQRPAWITLLG